MGSPPTSEPDERVLAEQLADMARASAEAEGGLLQLAAALFPRGPGSLRQVTWPERGGDEGAAVPPIGVPDERAEASARLNTAEARYQTLVEQIPAVTFMAVLGEGKNEVYVSPHIETLLGFTQAEWLEDPFLWFRQLHPADREIWIDEFARGCRTGGPFRAECRFLARDGREVWVRGEARIVKDALGRPMFLQGVAFDITENRRAQDVLLTLAVQTTEARYRDVVQGIGAIFWEADARTLRFTFVSPQVERILGVPGERWLGDPQFWMTLIHPDDRERVTAEWQAVIRDGADRDLEYRVATATGDLVWLHNRIHVVRDDGGRPRHLLGFMLDVTERRRAEEERARLAAIVESSDDAIVSKTPGGVITSWNRGAEKLFGYSAAEAIGQHIRLIIPPERHDEQAEVLRHVLRGETVHPFETVRVRKDGARVDVSLTVSPVRDPSGRVIGASKTARDIGDRRRAEQERARLLALEQEARAEAETLNRVGRQLAAELDLRKLVQAVTDAGRELTGARFGAFFYNVTDERGESYMLYTLSGASPEAFAGFPLPRNTPLFEPTFRGEGSVRVDDVRADPRYGRNPPHHGTPPGHLPVRSYLAVPVVLRSGQVLGGLFFGHPEPGRFTERHERLLGGLAGQAAVAVDNARLYAAADEARRTAEAANRAKDEFLATVSHELRTPLTAVLGWARLLHTATRDPAMLARGLGVIERNAAAQAQLIDDLLDVSRIILGKLELEWGSVESLGPLVASVVDSFQPTAAAKGIELASQIDPLAGPIAGDHKRLQQVIWNLVSNAVKFTPEGGRVEVACRRLEDAAELRVSDTGRGISATFLPRIFDRFSQADATTTRAHGGLGLGLAIVRHLVELHGGSVSAESAGEGRGATFTMRLPLAGVSGEPGRPLRSGTDRERSRERARTLQGLRVLIVEDDDDSREFLMTALKEAGAIVESVATAAAALATLDRWTPDLLVCDIGLAGEDGYSLIGKVRARGPQRGGAVPALALTAYASTEDQRRALAAGFELHLAKPVDPAALVGAAAQLRQRVS